MGISDRDLMLYVALRYLGTWYSWGGDDPSGFDCSGFAVELGKSVGKVARGTDYTADGLYNLWPKADGPATGRFVFYGIDKAVHVEMCLNERLAIGASGGGSKTITKDDAIRDNAFIKVRPIQRGRNILGYADPFKDE